MFVTAADFNLQPYNFPNLDKVPTNFAAFIAQEEERNLRELMGNILYDEFVKQVPLLPSSWVSNNTPGYAINDLVVYGSDIYKSLVVDNLGVIPDSDGTKWELQLANRWLKLMVGDNYLWDTVKQKWYGMKELVKPLIYALWLRDQINDNVSAAGVVQAETENSKVVGSGIRFGRAFNRYSELAVGMLPSRVISNLGYWNRSESYLKNSLFGYLWENSTDFDDLVTDTPAYQTFQNYLSSEFQNPGKVDLFDF